MTVMDDYVVISKRVLTGTIRDLPYATRLAWNSILFEAERLRGKVKLPVADLAYMAHITRAEAAEALRAFQEPDPWSSSKEQEGRRLVPIPGEEDWYQLVTWAKHREERELYFNRLRQQRKRKVAAAHRAGVCDCCGRVLDEYACRDHDRKTGLKRGVVCQSCSSRIGRLENGKPLRGDTDDVTQYLAKFGVSNGEYRSVTPRNVATRSVTNELELELEQEQEREPESKSEPVSSCACIEPGAVPVEKSKGATRKKAKPPPTPPPKPPAPEDEDPMQRLDPGFLVAADAYRYAATQVGHDWPALTDRALLAPKLQSKFLTVTAELLATEPDFDWPTCFTRAVNQPFVYEGIGSFDFVWFLKRESGGPRLNAMKVWHGQFADKLRKLNARRNALGDFS